MNKTYIEIRKRDGSVVKRIDVTDKSERAINRVEDGMNINLNHAEYYTTVETYEAEQPLNP